jgi:hypothetical protein
MKQNDWQQTLVYITKELEIGEKQKKYSAKQS